MQPVICFYENQTFIYSTDYQLLSCADEQDVIEFFNSIELKHAQKMKVVKINFSALEPKTANDSRWHYIHTAKASVYVLNKYELVTQEQLEHFYPDKVTSWPAYNPTVSETVFIKNVESIKVDICRGRFYQMNYTAALEAQAPVRHSLLSFFVQQAKSIGADYRAYLPLGPDESITCLSPELFLRKKGAKVITQPIKGTLLSGASLSDLQNSTKESAELSMIVDLLRNDLNTLSCDQYNDSSKVNFHRKILELKYTTHTYSEIEINTSKKFSEILAKTFPGGSISGCPKKESLKKIAEVENYHRDFYTGSIGWWQNDDFSLNIAIRSMYQKARKLFYFTGCGIVFDSEPQKEWHEFLTKCSFLNLYATFSPVVDTLKFDQEIVYLPGHIERTYLALRDQQVQVELYHIQALYQKITTELQARNFTSPQKVRLTFAKDLSYSLEASSLPINQDLVTLQPITHRQFLPRFKTIERGSWDNLVQQKDPKADDVLVINAQDLVTETSIYSVFYKIGDEMFTPPVSDGCLHSVFQTHHIKKGFITVNDKTYKLSERSLPAAELPTVEIYVGNSVRGLQKASLLF
ncbi:MAG: bifunctional chorismate-binding protein/class IV aminotransferase [Bdellovibrionota bacterium]